MSSTQSHSQIPHTQRAWLVERRGKPARAVALKEGVPVPSDLHKGEILVKVEAAALNPVGYKLMQVVPGFIAHRPHVAEHDFTGTVVDANGTDLTDGQSVYGFIPVPLMFKTHQGALAEYLRVPASHVVPRPSTLTPIQAAGLTLAGLTAYRALFRLAKIEQGQSIFINGGSTAVGIYATQLAKSLGCTVTASASAKKEPFVRSLGVDHFFDYTVAPIHEQLERHPLTPKFHVIFETVGGTDVPLYTHCEKYLAPGGVFISVGVMPYDGLSSVGQAFRYALELYRPRFLGGTNRTWKFVSVRLDRSELEEYAEYVKRGDIRPVVDSVYDFNDVPKAYERIMGRHTTGKVVVRVDPTIPDESL